MPARTRTIRQLQRELNAKKRGLVALRKRRAKAPRGMRARAIAAAVTRAGYKSFSKDFNAVVAKTLLDRKLFQRVSRGVYKLAK